MRNLIKQKLPILITIALVGSLVGGISIAMAALNFSGTTILGDSGVVVDGQGTISIGTSTATGITIGRSGVTTTVPGTLSITGTCVGCFTGAGDLIGNTTSQTVTGIQGIAVTSTIPLMNQVLQYNGFLWVPATISVSGNMTTINAVATSSFTLNGTANQITIATTTTPGVFVWSLPTDLSLTNATATGNLVVQGATTLQSSLTQSGGMASFGPTTINGNATTTNLVVTSLGSVGSPCLTVGVSGTVATTTCGSSTNYWSATSTGIYYNGAGTVTISNTLSNSHGVQIAASDLGPHGTSAYFQKSDGTGTSGLAYFTSDGSISATPTGTPTLPNGTTATTQSAGDNSTKLATTAYVNNAIPALSYWEPPSYYNTGASSTITSNTASVTAFDTPVSVLANYFNVRIVGVDNTANLYSVAVYGATGTLIAKYGPTAGTTFSPGAFFQNLAFSTQGTIPAGRFYVAVTTNCASSCASLATINGTEELPLVGYNAGVTSGGVLPSSITPPADSFTNTSPMWIEVHK